jgi:hypothetical protein
MSEEEGGQQATEKEAPLSIEPENHSFVVKIWLEETVDETPHPVWRGHITHVVSGQRRYVNNLSGITTFVAPYLIGWHIRLPWRERICLWLNRRK